MKLDESKHVSMLIFDPRFFQEAVNMSLFSNFNLYGETSSGKLLDVLDHFLLVM